MPIYAIIYTDKGKTDNPQTAERVFKMTFEQMRDIAKDVMERQIKFYSRNVISFDSVYATLSSYQYIDLFTPGEFWDYTFRIRHIKINKNVD